MLNNILNKYKDNLIKLEDKKLIKFIEERYLNMILFNTDKKKIHHDNYVYNIDSHNILVIKGDYNLFESIIDNFKTNIFVNNNQNRKAFSLLTNSNVSFSNYVFNKDGEWVIKKNIIKAQDNKHPFRRITKKHSKNSNTRVTVKEYIDASKNLELGFYLYCDKCKQYEPCNIFSIINVYDMSSFNYEVARLFPFACECNNCKTIINLEDVALHNNKEKNEYYTNDYIFVNDDEPNKITLSMIIKKFNCFDDKIIINNISKKLCFNIETGRTYLLPEYDLYKKKYKKDNIKCLNLFSTIPLKNIYMKEDNFLKIGKAIENYNRQKDSVNLINFEDYYNKAIKYFLSYKSQNNFADAINLGKTGIEAKKILYNNFYGDEVVNHRLICILIAYNTNPYVHVEEQLILNSLKTGISRHTVTNNILKKNRRKLDKVKIIKNKQLLSNCLTAININNKLSKKHLNEALNKVYNRFSDITNYSGYIESKIHALENINIYVEDINNRHKFIKFLNNEMNNQNDIYFYDFSALNSIYFKDLIKKHGENNVVNALLKDNKNLNYYLDTIRAYEYIKSIDNDYKFPVKRLRLEELHDKINIDFNNYKHVKREYIYNPIILEDYNKIIDGIQFKVAESNVELINIGSSMNICVGSYDNTVEQQNKIIVSLIKDNNYIGCLEINKDNVLYQAKGKYNHYLDNDIVEILLKYCKINNIYINTFDIDHENTELFVSEEERKESSLYKITYNKDEKLILDIKIGNKPLYQDKSIATQ